MPWVPFDAGSTILKKGSESGEILVDLEHPRGARITLEADTKTAPFAITCGVYDWMVHTRFFSDRLAANRELLAMKPALVRILDQVEDSDPESKEEHGAICTHLEEFIKKSPC